MNTIYTYRYELHKGSKKIKCTGCGQKTAVPYYDNEKQELLPDHVARCDRENNCGYHYTPKQYFGESGSSLRHADQLLSESDKSSKPVKIDFLPIEYLDRCVGSQFHSRNNFYLFLVSLFGKKTAIHLFSEYVIGTSFKQWKGAAMFPQIDEHGRVRQVKIMLHDPITGKRVKKGQLAERYDKNTDSYISEVTETHCSKVYGKYLDDRTKGLNLEQCFFGQHLLAEYDKPVCIVESEKTAMIASVFMPQFIWLATGGASGCKWREYGTYKVLKGRSVTFFPDHGYYNLKSGKTCFREWSERCERIREALPGTKIKVSDLLERMLIDEPRQDQDLVDILLKQINSKT